MAKEVLQNDRFPSGRKVVDAALVFNFNGSSMGWSQPDPYWRTLRAICNNHMFANQRLDSSQGLRRLKVRELISNMLEKSAMKEVVDIGQAAFVATINWISTTIFCMNVVDLNSESANEFNHLVWGFMEEFGRPNVEDYFPLLRPLCWGSVPSVGSDSTVRIGSLIQ